MANNRQNILRSSLGVAVATLASRVLGLVRTMLEARYLGGGVAASAWNLAITVPNLFRRLLGEGALSSALIPILTGIEAEEGEERVRYNLSVVFAVLSMVLLTIVAVVGGLAYLAQIFICPLLPTGGYEHVILALKLLPVVMPYAFFICLVGVSGSILNTRRVFFLPALGALTLNVALIATMLAGRRLTGTDDPIPLLNYLAFATLLAGVVHLGLMLLLLWRHRRLPELSRAALGNSPMLRKLWRLMLPGLIGASATQISFIVDRSLAAWLGPEAVPALCYTERLVDLPIGVFALAMGSVLLADMSRAAARGDKAEFLDDIALGLRHVYFICIPLTAFIVVFRHEILSLLLLGGEFNQSNLDAAGFAALFYTLGIPVFCAQKVIIPAFHSRKDMTTPLKVALWAILLNLVLNLILMWPLAQGGIALATVIAASFNNLTLIRMLRKQGFGFDPKPVIATFAKSLAAAVPAVAAARFLYGGAESWHLELWKPQTVPLICTALAFTVFYTILTTLLRCRELRENLNMFIRR